MDDPNEVVLISDVVNTHSGQWLALEVITRDENNLPMRVRVLAAATDRLALREKIKNLSGVYVKYAGPLAPAGYGVLY